MTFTTIQLVVFAVLALVLVVGVIFIIQDTRAHNRRGREFSSRRQANRQSKPRREREPL